MPEKKKPKTLRIVDPYKKKLKSKEDTPKKKKPKTLRIKEEKPKKKMPKTLRIKEPAKPKKKLPKTLRIKQPAKPKINKCDRCGAIDRIFAPQKYRKLGSGNYCLNCIGYSKGELDYDPADYVQNQSADMLDYYRSYNL
tara:strand:+ start:372 stop:788 length:417 start_codon:yes stop_codon:yes gene_type:complete